MWIKDEILVGFAVKELRDTKSDFCESWQVPCGQKSCNWALAGGEISQGSAFSAGVILCNETRLG